MSQQHPRNATTATAAIDSILDVETGILVPPGDSRALTEVIIVFLTDPEGEKNGGGKSVERDFRQGLVLGETDYTLPTTARGERAASPGRHDPGRETLRRFVRGFGVGEKRGTGKWGWTAPGDLRWLQGKEYGHSEETLGTTNWHRLETTFTAAGDVMLVRLRFSRKSRDKRIRVYSVDDVSLSQRGSASPEQ